MAPPTGSLRVGRYFLALLAILAVLYSIVFWPGSRHTPKLGIDLVGGTEVVFTAVAPHGHSVSSSSMSQAKQIMTDRVNGTGVTEATVVIQGTDQLVVSIPGQDADLAQIGKAAKLNFRPLVAPAVPVSCTVASAKPTTSPTSSTSPSTTPSKSTTPSSGTSTTPAGTQPSSSHSGADFAARPLGAATPSKTPTSSATPTGSTTPTGTATGTATPTPTSTASTPTAPPVCSATPMAEVAAAGKFVVPLSDTAYLKLSSSNQQLVQAALSDFDCSSAQKTETDDPKSYFVACDGGGNAQLLGPVIVPGTQISTASAVAPNAGGTGGSSQWTVSLTLKGSGPKHWATYTHDHNIGTSNISGTASPSTCGPTGYACANYVSFTLDGVVISTPVNESTINTPQTQISGGFTEKSATELANQLKYGALPLTFRADDAQTISATLGTTQLKAGLLAGGIGLALVIIYTLIYYRALGLVTISSLLVSGALTYGCLVMLATQIKFTLSLAGIAGFIVAIGITADSFVVFFERIKDEVHEGRSARVAIPRAWVRARRTILSADTVSFLAAAILYYFAAGDVKGFAFTLGLSTILDLVVVFLFTHPLVSYLSKFPAFGSRRFTGLDAVRGGPAISDVVLPAPGRRAVGRPAAAPSAVAVVEREDDSDVEAEPVEVEIPTAGRIVLSKADIEKTASAAAATTDDEAVDEVDTADEVEIADAAAPEAAGTEAEDEPQRQTDPEPGSAAERAAARQAKLREERRNQKGKS